MAVPTKPAPFDHEALKASLRSARLQERDDKHPITGSAYCVATQDDVLEAIGSYRRRFNCTPTWFEWKHKHTLILGTCA